MPSAGRRVTDDDVRRRRAMSTPAPGAPEPAAAAATLLAPAVLAPPLPRFEQWGPVERIRCRICGHDRRAHDIGTIIPHVTLSTRHITDLDAYPPTSRRPARTASRSRSPAS
jgi:hypothetical protein